MVAAFVVEFHHKRTALGLLWLALGIAALRIEWKL